MKTQGQHLSLCKKYPNKKCFLVRIYFYIFCIGDLYKKPELSLIWEITDQKKLCFLRSLLFKLNTKNQSSAYNIRIYTTQKMKFFINDFLCKYPHIY